MKLTPISWEGIPKFLRQVAERKPERVKLADVVTMPSAVKWVAGLNKIEVVGSKTEIARLTRTLFGTRKISGRFLHTAYFLPEDLEGFFSGSARANLRKSSNAAKRDGFTARWIHGPQLLDALNEVLIDRQSKKEHLNPDGLFRNTRVSLEEVEGVVVYSPDGSPVSIILGLRIDGLFLLRMALSSETGRARWLAFAILITEGHQRGIRTVIGERVWALGRGDIQFQERLGFVPVNLRFKVRNTDSVQCRIVS